jgi:hypothetical protein
MLSSTLLLTACGHYQYLEQDKSNKEPSSQTNNRYSQGDVILDGDRKEDSPLTPKQAAKNIKTSPSLSKESVITLTKPKQDSVVKIKQLEIPEEPSLWSNFIEIFTPEKVKPWQKSILAKATMKSGGLTPASEKFNQKIYSSKESSRGGLGVAGGGCGCN